MRRALGVAVIVLGSIVGPVTVGVGLAADRVATTPPPTSDPASDPATNDTGLASNPFIPDVNIGDCVSSLPRPGCGTDQQSGYHQYLTLLVLFLATAFIGWRIARGVRSRDKAANAPPPPNAPASKV